MADQPKPAVESLLSLLASYQFKVEGKWFYNQTVYLDGYTFSKCRFDNCRVITEKGTFRIENCAFFGCQLVFNAEAFNIIRLYNIGAEEAKQKWPWLCPTINNDGTISILPQALR